MTKQNTYYISVIPYVDDYCACDAFDYEEAGNEIKFITMGGSSAERPFEEMTEMMREGGITEQELNIRFVIQIIDTNSGRTIPEEFDVYYSCPVTPFTYCRYLQGQELIDFSLYYLESPFCIYMYRKCSGTGYDDYSLYDPEGHLLSTIAYPPVGYNRLREVRSLPYLFVVGDTSVNNNDWLTVVCNEIDDMYGEYIPQYRKH